LSPVWLLAAAGALMWLAASRGRDAASRGREPPEIAASPTVRAWDERRLVGTLTFALSLIVIGFYLGRSRWNYGGGTTGPRWLMWLTPLWLLVLLPVADWLSRSRGARAVALILFA